MAARGLGMTPRRRAVGLGGIVVVLGACQSLACSSKKSGEGAPAPSVVVSAVVAGSAAPPARAVDRPIGAHSAGVVARVGGAERRFVQGHVRRSAGRVEVALTPSAVECDVLFGGRPAPPGIWSLEFSAELPTQKSNRAMAGVFWGSPLEVAVTGVLADGAGERSAKLFVDHHETVVRFEGEGVRLRLTATGPDLEAEGVVDLQECPVVEDEAERLYPLAEPDHPVEIDDGGKRARAPRSFAVPTNGRFGTAPRGEFLWRLVMTDDPGASCAKITGDPERDTRDALTGLVITAGAGTGLGGTRRSRPLLDAPQPVSVIVRRGAAGAWASDGFVVYQSLKLEAGGRVRGYFQTRSALPGPPKGSVIGTFDAEVCPAPPL